MEKLKRIHRRRQKQRRELGSLYCPGAVTSLPAFDTSVNAVKPRESKANLRKTNNTAQYHIKAFKRIHRRTEKAKKGMHRVSSAGCPGCGLYLYLHESRRRHPVGLRRVDSSHASHAHSQVPRVHACQGSLQASRRCSVVTPCINTHKGEVDRVDRENRDSFPRATRGCAIISQPPRPLGVPCLYPVVRKDLSRVSPGRAVLGSRLCLRMGTVFSPHRQFFRFHDPTTVDLRVTCDIYRKIIGYASS